MNINGIIDPIVRNAMTATGRVAKNAPNPERLKATAIKYLGDALNGVMRCYEVYKKLGLNDDDIKRCQETLKAEFSKVNALGGRSTKFNIGDVLFYRNRNHDKMAGVVRKILNPVGGDGKFTYQLYPVKNLPSGYESVSWDVKIDEDSLAKVK